MRPPHAAPSAGVPSTGAVTARQEESDWLRRYRPQPHAAQRLVCLPHAGGNAPAYRSWAAAFPGAVDVVSVQYPGRLDRIGDTWSGGVDDLVAVLVRVLARDPRPTAVFGHSLGAVLGYEVARAAQQAGSPLIHLFVSGREAPQRLRRTAKHLADDEELWAEIARLGGTSPEALDTPDLRAVVLPSLRQDYRLAETYTPPTAGDPLRCPVTALVGDDDPEADVREVAGWGQVTTGAFRLEVFPGDHFYLQRRQAEVLAVVRAALLARPTGSPGAAR